MPKQARFKHSEFEEREFDENAALDKLQVLARALRSSQLGSNEYACLLRFVAGKSLNTDEQIAFREALRKTLGWVFKQIRMEYQVDSTKKIMTSLLSTQIQDYVYGRQLRTRPGVRRKKRSKKDIAGIERDRATRQRGLRRGEQARDYLFLDSKESGEYVFGFMFLCRYLGFDINKLREAIKERAETQDYGGLEDIMNL